VRNTGGLGNDRQSIASFLPSWSCLVSPLSLVPALRGRVHTNGAQQILEDWREGKEGRREGGKQPIACCGLAYWAGAFPPQATVTSGVFISCSVSHRRPRRSPPRPSVFINGLEFTQRQRVAPFTIILNTIALAGAHYVSQTTESHETHRSCDKQCRDRFSPPVPQSASRRRHLQKTLVTACKHHFSRCLLVSLKAAQTGWNSVPQLL